MPPPSEWEPGKTYTYKRTRFVPIYPYTGPVEVRMGLYPFPGRGERLTLKGEDAGLREYKVATVELVSHTENIYVTWKEGFHPPEAHAENPNIAQTWTKQEGVLSFKNPKKDVVVYLEADTCVKCFGETRPELTVAIGPKVGLRVPIQDPNLFLLKIRVKGDDLGTEEYVDIKLRMNASFVPKLMSPPQSNDDRVLGLRIANDVSVIEADKIGPVEGVVDAQPLGAGSRPGQGRHGGQANEAGQDSSSLTIPRLGGAREAARRGPSPVVVWGPLTMALSEWTDPDGRVRVVEVMARLRERIRGRRDLGLRKDQQKPE